MNNFKKWLTAADGKFNLKVDVSHETTKTLKLTCSPASGYLCLDVDTPTTPLNKKLLALISKNDFIVFSNKYTIENVFEGKCNYKVIFSNTEKRNMLKGRNKAIEIFYNSSNNKVAIIGKKTETENYINVGKVQPLNFNVNDVLEFPIVYKKTSEKTDLENVSIDEAQQKLAEVGFSNVDFRQNENNLITFKCLFLKSHTNTQGANAWLRKIKGKVQCFCQGEICRGEYLELNKKLSGKVAEKKLKENTFDDYGFQGLNEKMNVFISPTGSGKTETLVQEIAKNITLNKPSIIIFPTKEAIRKAAARFNAMFDNNYFPFKATGKIVEYTADEKEKWEIERYFEMLNGAIIIMTHKTYFEAVGDLITYFPMTLNILTLKKWNIYWDEAHSAIEGMVKNHFIAGGYYERLKFTKNEGYIKNTKKLTPDDIEDKHLWITNCMRIYKTEFGSVKLKRENEVYDKLKHVDLYNMIKTNMEMINKFDDEFIHYKVFKNKNKQFMKPNTIKDANEGEHLFYEACDFAIVAINMGDEIKRKDIGRVDIIIIHSQLIREILKHCETMTFITATFNDIHKSILENAKPKEYELNIINNKVLIEKLEKIILMKPATKNSPKNRKDVMEALKEHSKLRGLVFFPTIYQAEQVVIKNNHIEIKKNELICINDKIEIDDEIRRNITAMALESAPAKGSNLIEEISLKGNGFDLVYFDNAPVSHKVLKFWINNNDEIINYNENYDLNTFIQAIGRAVRKEKKQLIIIFNIIKDKQYLAIKKYLEQNTNAIIEEQDLNVWTELGKLNSQK